MISVVQEDKPVSQEATDFLQMINYFIDEGLWEIEEDAEGNLRIFPIT